MKSLDELKDEIFKNLSKYPKIEAFFKDSLEERIKIDDDWIENALVHNILEGIWQDHPLVELIDSIYDDKENFEILRNKLTPKDDYDRKMHDVLAELNGYYRLKKSGFEKNEALRKDSEQKKPDFSAELDGQHYLFEAKNIRSPFDISNTLWDKCFARRFRCPEIYCKLQFSFVASRTWQDIRFKLKGQADSPFTGIVTWLRNVF